MIEEKDTSEQMQEKTKPNGVGWWEEDSQGLDAVEGNTLFQGQMT